ncbi:uncharacterized protein LOC120571701 isoform X1 [Perca fluviatilis]|uniref:uncharacterized protein LOC120571701 isoform X1 n=1 Tax=Perca fluviatilis TaxID=8168 RepID=UPI001965B62B|nr:uncharacterized protein LOC120571701 isoform X1 [Perca fluviatilis]
MMAGVTRILTFICIAGCHLSAASPVPRPALVVPAGQNVSLPCNLTSEITWYHLRSDQLLPLLTVSASKFGEDVVTPHAADVGRFQSLSGAGRGLDILEVGERDAGLYFCIGRCSGAVCLNRGINLVVDGVDRESARQPCWSLAICLLPALLVLCFLFIVGFYLCSGKPAVCCCNPMRSNTRQSVTEEVSLHYSSLKHADKHRPSGRGGTGLVEEDVTYSAVTSRKNPTGSHGNR